MLPPPPPSVRRAPAPRRSADPDPRAPAQALSKTVYNLFLPSLLLTNVVATLSAGAGGPLFWLPLAALAQVALGLLLAAPGAAALRLNDAERRVFLVCAGFGNSAALPLLFANALFDGAPAQLAAMISAVSFYLIGWTGLFWSIAYATLTGMPDSAARPGVEAQKKSTGSFRETVASTLKRALSPPLVAAFTGLLIGLIAPLRNVFVRSPVFAALKTLGTGYSPAAVLILAGSLARRVDLPKDPAFVNPESTLRLRRLAFGISMYRYVLMPILGLVFVRTAKNIFAAPFVKFAVLLEAIMPPAQNSTLILNLEKKPDAAASMARILLAVYLIGVLPVSVGLTYFLGLAGI